MRVTLVLPRPLMEFAAGQRRLSLEVCADARLSDALAQLSAPYPALSRRIQDEAGNLRRYVNVYVDGEECRQRQGLDTRLQDGATLHVIGSIAGG